MTTLSSLLESHIPSEMQRKGEPDLYRPFTPAFDVNCFALMHKAMDRYATMQSEGAGTPKKAGEGYKVD